MEGAWWATLPAEVGKIHNSDATPIVRATRESRHIAARETSHYIQRDHRRGREGQNAPIWVVVLSSSINRENDVLSWAKEGPRELRLDEIGESYGRYRLHVPELERSMMRSLESYGQISPIVVCVHEGRLELIDGFKRLGAARKIASIDQLLARQIEADERSAKAAIYGLNRAGGRTREIEEAWIVHALVREDGLTQVEVAELLGRHKRLGLPAAGID